MRTIVNGLVGQIPANRFQSGGRLTPSIVVVEVGIDLLVRSDERRGFREVRHGIQHDNIVRRIRGVFERQVRQEVYKPLEDEACRITAVSGRRSLRRTALEIAVAQFPSSGIVAESDGEIGLIRHTIMHLRAMQPRRIEVDASLHEIKEQRWNFQRQHVFDNNRGCTFR